MSFSGVKYGLFKYGLFGALASGFPVKAAVVAALSLAALPSAGQTADTADVAAMHFNLREAVVTATESHSVVNSSKIGEEAIEHIQPSSFADLLELLPGGRAEDPVLGAPQTINLRAAASLSDDNYSTSSLGTKFLIDGIPLNNDANLQATPVWSSYGSSFVNAGADMRTIPTDDIESVEIVRGIPSVEYGDLTSGMVKIKRRQGGKDLRARFKADMKSMLFYTGKGFEWGKRDKLTMNLDFNVLDSKNEPRNPRQNYRRFTFSYRVGKNLSLDRFQITMNGNLDYTGSFDTRKADKDLDFGDCGPIETYDSKYNRFVAGGEFSLRNKENGFFRKFSLTASATGEYDLIDRWKYVALASPVPLSTSLDEGEHDAVTVPYKYESAMQVDGRPFYAYLKASTLCYAGTEHTSHDFRFGLEWNLDKNFGKGVIFDPLKPFSPDMNVRPRNFSLIPANHQLSAYAEDNFTWNAGRFRIEAMAGLRAGMMLGLGGRYEINGRLHLDPRLNLRLNFPEFTLGGEPFKSAVSAGIGQHTKLPTMAQLFPNPIYYDITRFNYWPTDESKRRINLFVKKIAPTNYSLSAARNFKWEVRADAQWNGWSFSLTYFQEDMTSGFRNNSSDYTRVIYKDYDESAVDKDALTGPPSLENLPYQLDTLLVSYTFVTNGSRTKKEGVEFTLATKRLDVLRTKLTVNGAWFRTRYMNSLPQYYRPSVVVSGKTYPYVGIYEGSDNYLRDSFNTNFTFDTQIPRFGLIFSTSFQCQWFTGNQNGWRNPYPLAYIDKNLETHEFTEDSAANGVLALMIKPERDESIFLYNRVPFSTNVNLKVTKKLWRDRLSIAVFVNKILDYTPSYITRMGVEIRREVMPYFGMELNFRI